MTSLPEKKIIIIAGPNGAGKTTFAEEFLPKEAGCPVFVNADLIAAGLAPFEPERAAFRAGRLMLEEIFIHARRGESFAFETTLSGRGYARLISGWPCRRLPRQALFSPARDTRTGHCPCSSKGP
jgi:predicted ABC-type ATPase